ncbi:MAG: hypothetical protein WCK18_17990 [Prolixibacteraceae bacterium]
MSISRDSSKVERHKIVIFGAGKIGRSFIGQLFGCSGYTIVFVDVDQTIIDGLNREGCYRIVIKGDKEEEIIVPNVSAISAMNVEKVAEAIATAGIITVSVGKNVIEKIIPVMAKGLLLRNEKYPEMPLDIILAENMRFAATYVKELLIKHLPSEYPIDEMVGLVETSIGKMVPIIPLAELEKDPLVVFAEPYNTLIVDGNGFKLPIPEINGLTPKKNILAWVDQKAFIHNLGHATAAYFGFFLHPNALYMYQILEDNHVREFTKEVMLQSAAVLATVYPDDFTVADLEELIDGLIVRFRNKALKDTIFRVGQDLIRKLGPEDRFMGAIHLSISFGMPYDRILKAMSYGFIFTATDESGKSSISDKEFLRSIKNDFELALIEVLGYDRVLDSPIIETLTKLYKQFGMLN